MVIQLDEYSSFSGGLREAVKRKALVDKNAQLYRREIKKAEERADAEVARIEAKKDRALIERELAMAQNDLIILDAHMKMALCQGVVDATSAVISLIPSPATQAVGLLGDVVSIWMELQMGDV